MREGIEWVQVSGRRRRGREGDEDEEGRMEREGGRDDGERGRGRRRMRKDGEEGRGGREIGKDWMDWWRGEDNLGREE